MARGGEVEDREPTVAKSDAGRVRGWRCGIGRVSRVVGAAVTEAIKRPRQCIRMGRLKGSGDEARDAAHG